MAPISPMSRSARPWTEARSAGESASVSSALPETNARFQPTPFRNSPRMIVAPAWPGASPAMATAKISMRAPAAITGIRPKRSASQPERGEATYMPARWRETATPMMPTAWPWSWR